MILRRRAQDRYSEVLPEWQDETVVIIGGGPSLTLEQVAMVKAAHDAGQVRCIAINDAYLWAPWADVHYFADLHWYADHSRGIAKPKLSLTAVQVRTAFAAFAGERCTIEQNQGKNIEDNAVHMLRNRDHPQHGVGLSLDPSALVTGCNGGFQALNLAILAGATTAILLGFDGRPNADGKSHWSGGHPTPTPLDIYKQYLRSFSAAQKAIAAAGVQVINCSPDSAIDSFPKMDLAQALKA